jgi:eukaryotic-like serine/threonine-protein kinase
MDTGRTVNYKPARGIAVEENPTHRALLSTPIQEPVVSQPDRSKWFLGWNLDPSQASPRPRADSTQNRPGQSRLAPKRHNPWDETQSVARADQAVPSAVVHAANFTFSPEAAARDSRLAAGEAIDGETSEEPESESEPEVPPLAFPRRGEEIGGFRLISELGRGAFGRVYLAEEAGLGNRPVALKVTQPEGDEPRLLARLQHTHIVPIHSVADDPETGLRLMCMPYFGGANLAEVLEATCHHVPSKATGLSLLEALDTLGQDPFSNADVPAPVSRRRRSEGSAGDETCFDSLPVSSLGSLKSLLGRISRWPRALAPLPPPPPDERDPAQPARRFLRETSFVRASVWIIARLAEGLEHAHSRGLLHRDLKPSNILIAADGTPMLLDFNLAADSVSPEEGDRALIGGTLPYMAPEHLDAFNPEGTTSPEAVDERADIYALDLILFEMIAGQHPFPDPPPGRGLLEIVCLMTEARRKPPPSPRFFNHEIPRGLDAIVRKSLDPDPDRRHASAGDLAEDLRRFLDDRPLKFTPEPSLVEVVAKWARRNPKISGATPVALMSLALILIIGAAAWTLSNHLQKVSARLKVRVFEQSFLDSQFLLNIANGPGRDLSRGIDLGEETIRQAGVESRRDRAPSWLKALGPEEQTAMLGDLSELVLLTTRAKVYQADRSKSEQKRRVALEEAIDRLNQMEKLDPHPSHALYADRARYHTALGQATEAALDRDRRDSTPLTTGRDFYLLGTALLTEGQPDRAEPALIKAIGLDPRRFWAWFALGHCHYDQGRFAEAAGDFALCTVLAPKVTWPWMNRGLALARAGRLVEARDSYNRAVETDSRNAEALANRALTCLELGDNRAALDDLEKAIALGVRDPSVRVALAEALARVGRRGQALSQLTSLIQADPNAPLPLVVRGMLQLSTDPKAAEADFRQVLSRHPGDAGANLGLARLYRLSHPQHALAFADLALSAEPGRIEALELRAWLRGCLGDPLTVADVDRLIQTPTPRRLYNGACALALLSEARPDPNLIAQALQLLHRALESGYPLAGVRDDPDFRSLRSNPTFQKWTEPTPRSTSLNAF